jgi:hypothetical protein
MSEQDPISQLAKKIYWAIDVNAGGRTQLDVIESILRREGVRIDPPGELRPGRLVAISRGMGLDPFVAVLIGRKTNEEAVVEFRGNLLCYEKSRLTPLPDAPHPQPSPEPEPAIESCGFIPPTPGYAPCTRQKGHDGPCAHPLAPKPPEQK